MNDFVKAIGVGVGIALGWAAFNLVLNFVMFFVR